MAGEGDRTLEASEQRREEFRKQGRYARAKELGGVAATIAAVMGIYSARSHLADAVVTLFGRTVGDLGALERVGREGVFGAALSPILTGAAGILVTTTVVAVVAGAAQTRFRLNPGAIAIKFDRLDPKAGFERLFAIKKNLAELALSILRVGIVGTVAWRGGKSEIPTLLSIARAPVTSSALAAAGALGRVVIAVLVALLLLAVLDYVHSWFQLEQELKMTRQERIDESKQQEGDPKVKGRIRARARALARQRAIASVKSADVIVTNPTHVAVALRYGPKDVAPVVIAKGVDEIALRLRAEGRKHGVPILENKPLARALNAEVPVGRPVPQAHFAAVAQVLAFVFRLKKKGVLGGTRRAGNRA